MAIRSWSGVSYTSVGRKLKEIMDHFPGNHGDYYVTSSNRPHTPSSHHGGRLSYNGSRTSAIDIGFNYNGGSASTARGKAFAEWLKQFSDDTVELIHVYGSGTDGAYVKNTRFVSPYAVSAHRDHIHFAASSVQADRILAKLRNSNTPEEEDKLNMSDFTYHYMDRDKPEDLVQGELHTVPWHYSNADDFEKGEAHPSIMGRNQQYQCAAHVEVSNSCSDEGRYELYFGKVREGATDWSDEPVATLVSLSSEENQDQILCFDRNYGDEYLRLYIRPLDDDLTLNYAKATTWHAKRAGSQPLIEVDPNRSLRDIQEIINDAGYSPALKVDGIEGPNTTAGIRWYQGVIGASQDGQWGPATEQAHVDYVNKSR